MAITSSSYSCKCSYSMCQDCLVSLTCPLDSRSTITSNMCVLNLETFSNSSGANANNLCTNFCPNWLSNGLFWSFSTCYTPQQDCVLSVSCPGQNIDIYSPCPGRNKKDAAGCAYCFNSTTGKPGGVSSLSDNPTSDETLITKVDVITLTTKISSTSSTLSSSSFESTATSETKVVNPNTNETNLLLIILLPTIVCAILLFLFGFYCCKNRPKSAKSIIPLDTQKTLQDFEGGIDLGNSKDYKKHTHSVIMGDLNEENALLLKSTSERTILQKNPSIEELDQLGWNSPKMVDRNLSKLRLKPFMHQQTMQQDQTLLIPQSHQSSIRLPSPSMVSRYYKSFSKSKPGSRGQSKIDPNELNILENTGENHQHEFYLLPE